MDFEPNWCALALLAGAALANSTAAQRGDVKGEEQPPLSASLVVPPAPPLAPEAELATFQLPGDVAVELVAAEPLIHDPIAVCFDAAERLWAVEMTGYMPDVDGTGEREPTGAIVVLEDTDGDGRMDKRTVFLNHLVLPRAVRIARGGVLVLAPPQLLFCRDTDGDDVCDEQEVLDRGLEGLASPEWAINALLPTIDNAFYCAKAPWRYVFKDGGLHREATQGSGQWGATQDDQGRIFTDNNSDPLRCDLVPAIYSARNPNLGRVEGVDVRVVDDFTPRSARVNPGINRGYQPKMLTGDFHLALVTGTCAPSIVRGDRLPARYQGSAIVCEPTGNLVLDYALAEDAQGALHGAPNRWGPNGLDFITSTDERFRPVFACDGPDGALYIVDIYRGLIQHKNFVTSFLRQQVLSRSLDKPIGLGRIWRVSAKSRPPSPQRKKLADTTDAELVRALDDANGWRRDTAQRLIVESFGPKNPALAKLRELALGAERWTVREQALWALAGVGAVDRELVLQAFGDRDPRVVVAALRVSEALAANDRELGERRLALARTGAAPVKLQALFSIGSDASDAALAQLVELSFAGALDSRAQSAIVSGLYTRDVEFLARWFADSRSTREAPEREQLLELVARSAIRDGRAERCGRFFELLTQVAQPKSIEALCRGALAARPPNPLGNPGYVRLAHEPKSWAQWVSRADLRSLSKVAELDSAIAWPGRAGVNDVAVRELSAEETRRFERGRAVFAESCAACHQANGAGQAGAIPPLRGSPIALGKAERTVRILIHGLQGPVTVANETFDAEMPGFAASDDELASVLTYVRREWGNGAEPIDASEVARVRAASAARVRAWTIEELEPFAK